MDAVSYKCPACGAGIAFDIETQLWRCKFCGSDFNESAFNEAQARVSKEQAAQTEVEQSAQSAQEEKQEQPRKREVFESAVKFSCPSCGGDIIADENTAATFCVFCHNPAILSQRVSDEYRPDLIIPFQVGREKMLEALKKYCSRRPLLSADFKEYIEKGEISGLYVPFWLFSAQIGADMQAEGTRVMTWSDAHYNYTKTDYYAVRRVADSVFRRVPADGSSRMDDKLMEKLEPYYYKNIQAFDAAFLSGHFAERYDVDDRQCSERAVARMKKAAEKAIRATITGFNGVNVLSYTDEISGLGNEYALLPV